MLKSVSDVSHGFGHSGDPDGSYSELSRRVDMLQAWQVLCQSDQAAKAGAKAGTRTSTVTGRGCQVSNGAGDDTGPTTQAEIQLWLGSVARTSTTGPDSDMLGSLKESSFEGQQNIIGGSRSTWCLEKDPP
ncbi:hypothetical protein TIFTF001_009309 [Ficus carica]|uniref:Uncharacterized protein n=1 Tax=Ficus carica TaxID=3494 RepID=A0AA87ZUF6_FICCA|nr:hypothetical protein TIFTF001_009309 [Ficus carica]